MRQYGGDRGRTDYFRLLEMSGDHLIVGAADSVHNISLERLEDAQPPYEWESGKLEKDDCAMRGMDKVRPLSVYHRAGSNMVGRRDTAGQVIYYQR